MPQEVTDGFDANLDRAWRFVLVEILQEKYGVPEPDYFEFRLKRSSKTLRSRGRLVVADRTVYAVILVIDRQGLLTIESDLDKSHIPLRQPETVYLLVLTHKVGAVYPERKLLCRMAFNSDNGVVFNVNPDLAFKQILVFPPRDCPYEEAVVRPHLLLAKRLQDLV